MNVDKLGASAGRRYLSYRTIATRIFGIIGKAISFYNRLPTCPDLRRFPAAVIALQPIIEIPIEHLGQLADIVPKMGSQHAPIFKA